jgi:hypothetical protein
MQRRKQRGEQVQFSGNHATTGNQGQRAQPAMTGDTLMLRQP